MVLYLHYLETTALNNLSSINQTTQLEAAYSTEVCESEESKRLPCRQFDAVI